MKDLAEALESLKGKRFGMVSWDIPKEHDDLAEMIRRVIRPHALMVHESGYLFPWEHKATLLELIREAHVAINERRTKNGKPELTVTKVRALPIDPEGLPEIVDWAHERMREFVARITESFETRTGAVLKRVEEAIEKGKLDVNEKAKNVAFKKKAIIRDLKRRVSDAEQVFFWFAVTDDVKSAMKASNKLFESEMQALKEVAQIGTDTYKQEQVPEGSAS